MGTSKLPERVVYPGGHTFDLEAIGLAVDLSCRGFDLSRRGPWLHVEPPNRLTAADVIAIRSHRAELLRITDYVGMFEASRVRSEGGPE